jgi:hypothetical protein
MTDIETKIFSYRKKLATAKSEYDKALGSMESIKKQAMENADVKRLVDEKVPLGKALSQTITALTARIEEMEAEIENDIKQFEVEYHDIITDER